MVSSPSTRWRDTASTLRDPTEEQRAAMEAFIARDTPNGVYYSFYAVTDTVLLLDGVRPAAAVIVANVGSVSSARLAERNPVIDLARAFNVDAAAVAGAAPHANVTCALSNDEGRLDGIQDARGSSRRFGAFLDYPTTAVRAFAETENHGGQWEAFLVEYEPTDDELAALATLPYTPEPSDEGLERGLTRGRRYRGRLEALASTYGGLADALEARTTDVRERIGRRR